MAIGTTMDDPHGANPLTWAFETEGAKTGPPFRYSAAVRSLLITSILRTVRAPDTTVR